MARASSGRWAWPTYPRSYTTVPDDVVDELVSLLDRVAPASKSPEELLPPFDPEDDEDGRKRIQRAITERKGQGAFRAAVMTAYGGRCAISGCRCPDVLDAAHISPYNGEKTNDVRNGLLLRTDLHTLFDGHRIAIDPETMTVVVDPSIEDRTYRGFHTGRPRRRGNGARDHVAGEDELGQQRRGGRLRRRRA